MAKGRPVFIRPEFKDVKLRQIFAGFISAAIADCQLRGLTVTPRLIEDICLKWDAEFENLGGADNVVKWADTMRGPRQRS